MAVKSLFGRRNLRLLQVSPSHFPRVHQKVRGSWFFSISSILVNVNFRSTDNHTRSIYIPFRLNFTTITGCCSVNPVDQFKIRAFLSRNYAQSVESDLNPFSDDLNEICRLLSDFRSPHHELEPALDCFSGEISTDLVEQVLKRCKNLGVSALRFFIWAGKIPGFEHSRESYQVLVDILGSNKQFPLIWDLLIEMKNRGLEIKPKIFWVIFRNYARANLPNDAIRAFKRMDDFDCKPSIDDLDRLIYTLCRNNLVGYAQELFDKVKSEFPVGLKTYSILIKGWGDSGNPSEAQRLFMEMIEKKCPLDVVVYNSLLGSLCRCGKIEDAYKLFCEMKSDGLVPNASTYASFVHAYCKENDVNSAVRVFDRMRRYNLVPNVFTYNSLIRLFCKNERVDDAYQLLDEMIEKGLSPDIWSYNTIQAAHCELQEVNKALRLLHRMDRESCKPDRHTYNMLLKMLIEVGRIDRTTEVWNSMEGRGFYASVTTYASMIHGLCKKGKVEDACRYFETMIDEGVPPYPSTCEFLRNHLLRVGLREKTQILATKMQQTTSCSIQELSNIMNLPSSMDMMIHIKYKKGHKVYSRSSIKT